MPITDSSWSLSWLSLPGVAVKIQQGLVLVEVVQHLAVHFEHAQLGGPDAFLVAAVGLLSRARSRAGRTRDWLQAASWARASARLPGPWRATSRPQVGGEGPAVHVVVFARVDLADFRPGEPAVDHAAVGAGIGGLVAEQRDGRRGLQQGLAEAGDDLGGGVLQAGRARA